jgi:hypothetical protein
VSLLDERLPFVSGQATPIQIVLPNGRRRPATCALAATPRARRPTRCCAARGFAAAFDLPHDVRVQPADAPARSSGISPGSTRRAGPSGKRNGGIWAGGIARKGKYDELCHSTSRPRVGQEQALAYLPSEFGRATVTAPARPQPALPRQGAQAHVCHRPRGAEAMQTSIRNPVVVFTSRTMAYRRRPSYISHPRASSVPRSEHKLCAFCTPAAL